MAIRMNEDLDPNEGPGLGCFTVQAVLFAVILLLIPVGVFTLGWPVWFLTVLLVIAIILLFFISMTSVFLLRVFFATRRSGRGRTFGATAEPREIDTTVADAEPGSETGDEPGGEVTEIPAASDTGEPASAVPPPDENQE